MVTTGGCVNIQTSRFCKSYNIIVYILKSNPVVIKELISYVVIIPNLSNAMQMKLSRLTYITSVIMKCETLIQIYIHVYNV